MAIAPITGVSEFCGCPINDAPSFVGGVRPCELD